ncbi:MAG: MBL fold metallo-hydrolase [Ruminococcus sp.]|nr:MBL fold metallo-hydrolase [Ruminococcus sp.]
MLDFITVNTHSSIRINDEKVIYIDPFRITEESHDADIILITHSHYDHFSPDDIKKVMKQETVLVCPESMKEADDMGLEVVRVSTSDKIEVLGISIETVAAYNKLKPFHPKSNGWVGYIINSSANGRIYIAGDTDLTSENQNVKCDIAMLPVGGTYTMNFKKAAKLANIIKPEYAVPIHYGSVTGSPEDGENFHKLVDSEIKVVIKIK